VWPSDRPLGVGPLAGEPDSGGVRRVAHAEIASTADATTDGAPGSDGGNSEPKPDSGSAVASDKGAPVDAGKAAHAGNAPVAPVASSAPASAAAPADLFVGQYVGKATVVATAGGVTQRREVDPFTIDVKKVSDTEVEFSVPNCRARATVSGNRATFVAGSSCGSDDMPMTLQSGSAERVDDRLELDVSAEFRNAIQGVRVSAKIDLHFSGTKR
jgi:hypothetical protein